MRNRFLCLVLVLILTLPLILGSCTKEIPLEDEPAPVYTLYCITGDTTTDVAVTQVEYEINRTLFYRIGSIVKLEFVTADEYHDLLEAKKTEIDDYLSGKPMPEYDTSSEAESTDESATTSGSNKKNDKDGKRTLTPYAKLSETAIQAGYEKMSGEAILNDLEAGIPIELECPRLDLFLITDYQAYLEMAENGDLAALDTVLSNEAKAIKSYVHSSFFNAAKVGTKTYGVPCNTNIGQYTYLVFDAEVLKKSGVAQETLYGLEDLSDYLAIAKEQNPDVVPLANVITPFEFSYMFNDGFPTYVNENGHVRSTYEDELMNEYFAMLARYSALGYFENKDGVKGDNEEVRFAAKFISATQEEMEALAAEHGYVYNRYSVPIATSENSIDCIYGVSVLCPSSWLTDVMEILTELYIDEGLQNTFLYGIENEHYRLEGSQVVRLNKDYMMSYAHTGNCFIAYTDKDAGDSVDKWTAIRDQNIDAVESKTIGFTFVPKDFIFGTEKDEEGKDVEWGVTEANYEEILWNVVKPYYETLIAGTAITFDYDAEYAAAEQAALDSIYNELFGTHKMRLELQYTGGLTEQVTAEYGDQFRVDALEFIKGELMNQFGTTTRKKKLREKLQDENPEKTEEEIEQMAAALLEDKDGLWEYRTLVRKENQWEAAIENQYATLINDMVKQKTEEILNSAEYLAALDAIPQSEEFIEEYDYQVKIQVADSVSANLNKAISALITEYCDTLIAECEVALTEAIDEFAQEYADATQRALEEGVYNKLKELYSTEDESKLKDRLTKQLAFIKEHAEDDTQGLENALKDLLIEEDATLGDEANKEKLNDAYRAAEKVFSEVYLPLYANAYNGETLALVEIGYLPKSALKTFGSTETEEGEDGATEGDGTTEDGGTTDDAPVAGDYESYYEFVLTAKFQEPYYAAFGTPT